MFRPGDPAILTLFKPARWGVGLKVAGPAQRLSWIFVDDLVGARKALSADEWSGSFTDFVNSEGTMDTDRLYVPLHTHRLRSFTAVQPRA